VGVERKPVHHGFVAAHTCGVLWRTRHCNS
jgi:hypothetical protein